MELPAKDATGVISLPIDGVPHALTLQPQLQQHMEDYIKNHGNPVAAVVLAEVATGNILILGQGKNPREWHSTTNTVGYAYFPAASIFKFIPAFAATDMAGLDGQYPLSLPHGCANVDAPDQWLKDPPHQGRTRQVTLEEAFGHSCNAYFAKLTVLDLGLGAISRYAEIFGWASNGASRVSADFAIDASPFHLPIANGAGVTEVGSFSAGFGPVGMSPVHAAWAMLLIANNGIPKPLHLFKNTPASALPPGTPLFSEEAGVKMRTIMHKTVQQGTATTVFHRKAYQSLQAGVGAKTGTLLGRTLSFPEHTPANGLLSTWLTAVYPYDKPEVVVAAVVANTEDWQIKGSQLAAEALHQWDMARKGVVAQAEPIRYKGKRRQFSHHHRRQRRSNSATASHVE